MIRFNRLKILIPSCEAKPGGQIGAMLSPYLFSVNMSEFIKKFNEITSNEFLVGIIMPVIVFCDIIEKSYSFFIKLPYMGFFFTYIRKKEMRLNGFIKINYLYDLVCIFSENYGISLIESAKILFGVYKSFKRRYKFRLSIYKIIEDKLNNV